jgi:membrane protein DedA with SNARE-associated domain
VEDAADALGGWVYPFVAGMAFLETAIPPVTLVFPGEFGVLLGGAIAGVDRADIVTLVAITWVCSVLGDSVCFGLGRRLGRPFLMRYGRPIGLTDERLQRLHGWFERYGPPTVAFGRLLPLARPFGPFVAGTADFTFRRFLLWNALGCLMFALVFCLVGYAFARSYDEAVRGVARGGFTVLALVGAAVAVVYLLRRRRHARIAAEEARP